VHLDGISASLAVTSVLSAAAAAAATVAATAATTIGHVENHDPEHPRDEAARKRANEVDKVTADGDVAEAAEDCGNQPAPGVKGSARNACENPHQSGEGLSNCHVVVTLVLVHEDDEAEYKGAQEFGEESLEGVEGWVDGGACQTNVRAGKEGEPQQTSHHPAGELAKQAKNSSHERQLVTTKGNKTHHCDGSVHVRRKASKHSSSNKEAISMGDSDEEKAKEHDDGVNAAVCNFVKDEAAAKGDESKDHGRLELGGDGLEPADIVAVLDDPRPALLGLHSGTLLRLCLVGTV
jgi:hypothetical protein